MTALLLMSAILGKQVFDSWMGDSFIVVLQQSQTWFQACSQTAERYSGMELHYEKITSIERHIHLCALCVPPPVWLATNTLCNSFNLPEAAPGMD